MTEAPDATFDPAMALQRPSADIDCSEKPKRLYRHPLPVRLWHWLNAVTVIVLLLSGFHIFNSHPRLYFGNLGFYDLPAVFEIGGNLDPAHAKSWIKIGTTTIPTTGVLGEISETPFGRVFLAFPHWLRLPMEDDLATARGWHFLMAWVLAISGALYVGYALISRRAWREWVPSRDQLKLRAIGSDIWMHLKLKHPRGMEAARYNFLQKLAYLGVLLLFLPTMILTGMTMSNSSVAAYPWLIDLFGGRQTARTIHFMVAISLALFILIHIFQVFVAGFVREMRSMITGYYEIPPEKLP